MQKFTKFNASETLDKAIPKIYEDIQTVASSSSGTAFPTDNLQVGMTCYRTDEKKCYILESNDNDNPIWREMYDKNFTPGVAEFDSEGHEISKYFIGKDGGTVDKPIKYSIAPVSGNELSNKDYVDSSIKSMAGELSKKLESAQTVTQNSITTSVSDLKTNGVSKLSTARKINDNDFDGTSDITITPAQISVGSTNGSTISELHPGHWSGVASINAPKKSSVVKVNPQNITFALKGLNETPAIAKGTYTLAQVLQILIANCHTHSTEDKYATATVNCWGDCNCNCDCNCGDDSGA